MRHSQAARRLLAVIALLVCGGPLALVQGEAQRAGASSATSRQRLVSPYAQVRAGQSTPPASQQWLVSPYAQVQVDRAKASLEGRPRPVDIPALIDKLTEGRADFDDLMRGLKDRDARQRAKAAEALGAMGPKAEAAIPALAQAAVKDADRRVRKHAGTALRRIDADAGVRELTKFLAVKDNASRARTAEAFVYFGTFPFYTEAFTLLYAAQREDDDDVRWWSSVALDKCCEFVRDQRAFPYATEAYIPTLLEMRTDEDEYIRKWAVIGLGETESPAVLPALMDSLSDESVDVRFHAVEALGRLGPAAAPAVPHMLREAAKLPFGGTSFALGLQELALYAVACVGPDALPATREFLKGKDRWIAIRVLEYIGPEIPGAISLLIEQLQHADAVHRHSAARALGRFGEKAKHAVPALTKALESEKDAVGAMSLIDALQAIDPGNKAVIPLLLENLKDKDMYVRRSAASALLKVDPGNQAVIPALLKNLKENDKYVPRDAASALKKMGLAARDAVPALREAVNDQHAEVAREAYDALVRIHEAEAAAAVATLVKELKDKDKKVRENAAKKLGTMGRFALDALPALTEAMKDGDPDVRRAAGEAIKKIRDADANMRWLEFIRALNGALERAKENPQKE